MKPSRIIPSFLLCVAVVLALSERSLLTAATAQTEDSIQSIRQRYDTINRDTARYRKVKKELSGFSAEGGQLTAYLLNCPTLHVDMRKATLVRIDIDRFAGKPCGLLKWILPPDLRD